MASSEKLQTNSKKCYNKPVHLKTSVEDLAEEGYTIGKVFGEGSYSKVRVAKFQGKEIAVKIIRRDLLSSEFETKFLPRELEILSKVQHPNIVHVYKIFMYPKRIYIFMELNLKGDLVEIILGRGRLMEFEAHHYFRQIVDGVCYLQDLNIAHRDLKCENIMINENDQIKIIDFGFARYAVNDVGRRVLSRTFCGSTPYASPEILQGLPYNPMMQDVWSLGCVLFIMLTGTMPFDDSNPHQMVKCQLKRKFKYPMSLAITKPIKSLISRMLEPDVLRRATMSQVSKCSWLKQRSTDILWIPRSSAYEYEKSDIYPTHSAQSKTQTDTVNNCDEHISSECNSKNNSVDSD